MPYIMISFSHPHGPFSGRRTCHESLQVEKNVFLSYLMLQQYLIWSYFNMFMLCSSSCIQGTIVLNKFLKYLARADLPMSFRGHLESLATPPLSFLLWRSLVARSPIAQKLLMRTISEDVTSLESLNVGDWFPCFPFQKTSLFWPDAGKVRNNDKDRRTKREIQAKWRLS